MGISDLIDDDWPTLPEESGQNTDSGFEPNDEWLEKAEPKQQNDAMQRWFLTRYCDPAEDTPYMSSEGGYLFIYGGPYDAEDELFNRFGDIFSEEVITKAVEDIESDGITDWAPMHRDYDDQLEYVAEFRSTQYKLFMQRIHDVDALLSSPIDEENQPLLRQLLFGSLITSLEVYLADTTIFWVNYDKDVYRRFVKICREFNEKKFPLSEIFDHLESLEDDVKEYLHNQIWHRLDKVLPIMESSLEISSPSKENLMRHIIVRHHIIHRGGKTKDGEIISISVNMLESLRDDVQSFVEEIEEELSRVFPLHGVI